MTNPLDAALFIGDSKPELVLLDLLMPQINGFELAGKIKLTSPETRIIIITGHATEENLARLAQYGVSAVVTKPFDFTVLKDALDMTLGQEKSETPVERNGFRNTG